MTEFFGICGVLALCSAVMLVLGGRERELSSLISAMIYVVAVVYVLSKVSSLVKSGASFLESAEEILPVKYILQAGGVAIFGAVTSSICEDVGQRGVAQAIDTLTVIEMICMFMPIGKNLVQELFAVFFE